MKKKLGQLYNNLTLASKIRYSYLILLIPMVLFLSICFYNLWNGNREYEDMVNSTVAASEFSLDFQADFDYEIYLLIVENASVEEADLDALLKEGMDVVDELEKLTDSSDNISRLRSVKKYLMNLATYKERIVENLQEGNRYQDNIEIWENDVQIVTSLVRESMSEYIYYEVKEIQKAREEYQNFFMTMIRILIVSFGVILLLILFESYFVPLSITRPIKEISKVTDQVARGDLSVRSQVHSGAEVGVLSESLNSMIEKINELLEQVTNEQIRLRKAELELLQSQINPHFLYNTLDTISWLAEAGDQKQVVSMVKSLSEFFRTSLNQGKDIISIRDELQHVRSYLEIQQVRYQDILTYEIAVPQELYQYLIPKITIQPLVENALYHGIKNQRRAGRIRIYGEKSGQEVLLYVEDNGIGMTQTELEALREAIIHNPKADGGSYGLYNVNERIRLKFGEQYGIQIDSVYEKGTLVSIHLPMA